MIDEELPNLWKPAFLGLILTLTVFFISFGVYSVITTDNEDKTKISNLWQSEQSYVQIQYAIVDWDNNFMPEDQPPFFESNISGFLDHIQIQVVRYDFVYFSSFYEGNQYTMNILEQFYLGTFLLGNTSRDLQFQVGFKTHGEPFLYDQDTKSIGTLFFSFKVLSNDQIIHLNLPVTNGTLPVVSVKP